MKITDDELLEEVMNGKTIRKIAEDYDMTPTGVFQRLHNNKIQKRYNELKQAEMESLKTKVLMNSDSAIELLVKIMNDESCSNMARIKAAKEILSLAIPKNNNLGG